MDKEQKFLNMLEQLPLNSWVNHGTGCAIGGPRCFSNKMPSGDTIQIDTNGWCVVDHTVLDSSLVSREKISRLALKIETWNVRKRAMHKMDITDKILDRIVNAKGNRT